MDLTGAWGGRTSDVIVVGGGLAGLTAAATVAQAGHSVTLLEQSKHLGGRAATNIRDDVHFNLGAHALYCEGHGFRTLKALGVPFQGAPPNPGSSRLALGNSTYPFPAGLRSLLTSRLFTISEKLRLAHFLKSAASIDPATLQDLPLSEWMARETGTGNYARLLHALFRLSTYGNDPEQQSAGSVIEQFQIAQRGVWYIAGGWQTLVDGLRGVIESADGSVQTGTRVNAVRPHADYVTVHTSDGRSLTAGAVILASTPSHVTHALEIEEDHPLRESTRHLRPAYAACLDIALTRLPRPGQRFALGLDRPMYFSVHSASVKLGPEGVHVAHVMQYIGPERIDPEASERELEAYLDTVQPGWRAHVHTRRFLPNMVVTHGIPLASRGGALGRPEVRVHGQPRVFLAGDWVGQVGQIADAAVASGETAARLAVEKLTRRSTRQPAHA